MFRDDWRTLERCVFLEWPRYRGEQTLTAMAGRVVSEAGIRDGDVVVGHSLGGMVACEITAMRALSRLVLVGSATRSEEVSRLLAVMHPLGAITPFRLAQTVASKLPGGVYEMFARSDPDFMRVACKAVFNWQGLLEDRVPVSRIHGRHDRVIPLPAGVDRVLEGGHMIPATHPRECVQFIESVLADGP